MPAELLIRPSVNDHLVVADLIAPGGAGRFIGARPPISRLVLDAPLAAAQPQYAEDARAAGLPVSVDPMTFLLQGDTDPQHGWSKLPFGRAPAITVADLSSTTTRRRLIKSAVDFEIEHGGTVIIPPYFTASSPEDPWFEISLVCLRETATYLQHLNIRLPIYPVLTGRLDRFARPANWPTGIDRFAVTAIEVGVQTVAMQLGPVGAPADNYAKVLHLFSAAHRLRRPGLAVHSWRQGTYGPALVAAGLQGYETGISVGEGTNLAAIARSRRPAPPPEVDQEEEESSGGGSGRVYLPALGRSVPGKVVTTLANNLSTRALILCDDSTICCPNGLESTLGRGRRAHAVRSRARYLKLLDDMPQTSWRLYKVAQDAQAAQHLIGVINSTLIANKVKPLNSINLGSLAAVAHHLRGGNSAVA